MKREYRFTNLQNEITCCDLYFPQKTASENVNKAPLVLLIHGFRAFKDWGFFPYFSQKLTEAGYISSSIDFSLNTLLDRQKSLFDMERFARNTVSQEISEINTFIQHIISGKVLTAEESNTWNGDIYLVGHSLGGALAIIVADSNTSVKKLVTINSIFDFDIYTEKQKKKWFELGLKEFYDNSTQQLFRLNLEFLTDRLTYVGEKSVAAAVSRLEIPYLIIHGDIDATVSPKAANILYEASNKSLSRLEFIKHGNHTFGIKHPFEKSNHILDTTIDLTINFFNS